MNHFPYLMNRNTRNAKRGLSTSFNLYLSWACYAANVLATFILSPYLIEELGSARYGLLMLTNALTGYLGIAELGTQAGLSKFLNHYLGKKETRKFNQVFNSGIVMFLSLGPLLLLASVVLSLFLDKLFPTISSDLLGEIRIAILITTANLFLNLLESPMKIALQAHNRFDVCSSITLITTLTRTLGTLAILLAGKGLIEVVAVQLFASFVGITSLTTLASRFAPGLEYNLRLVNSERVKEIFSFSAWAFMGSIGLRIVSSSDVLIITYLMGPKLVAVYAVADMLVQKLNDLVQPIISVYRPRIIQACAQGDLENISRGWNQSNTISMTLMLLGTVGLITFGDDFIALWLGEEFSESYIIIVILSISRLLSTPFNTATSVLAGLDYHRFLSLLYLVLAILNLVISVGLVTLLHYDITSVALGSLASSVLISAVGGFTAQKIIDVRTNKSFKLCLRWLAGFTLFYISCTCIDVFLSNLSWLGLALKTVLATLAFIPILWVTILQSDEKSQIRGMFAKS